MITPETIAKALRDAPGPLTVSELAARVGCEVRECDAILWQSPDQFVWQPGHKWTAANPKRSAPRPDVGIATDARSSMISAVAPRELRATTLSSGLTIAVNRRPMDSDAFFTVRSAGNTVTLTLNSTHELFTELPVPFQSGQGAGDYKELCEVLLSAWALYEDGLPGGSTTRATEDARLLWGRRVIEILRERDA